METHDLEKKLKELTRQLEKEKAEKKDLETRLEQKSSAPFNLKQFLGWGSVLKERAKEWAKKNIEAAPKARIVTDVAQSPVTETKKAMEEIAFDDIETYRRKLSGYDRHQIEDIYLHIDREAHPERFAAVVEALRRHLASK